MSAHELPRNWLAAPWKVADPGTAGTVNLDNKGFAVVSLTTTTTETRTIPAPEVAGQRVLVSLDTDGGNVTITITGGQGVSSVVLDDAGDTFMLESITVAGTAKWIPAWSSGPLSGFPSALGGNVTIPGTLSVTGALTVENIAVAAETAEHGAGAIGTGVAPATYRHTENGIIITEIKIDLEGLTSKNTANDAIGLAAGGNAYIGRNVVATNGIIFKIEQICVETPAGGDDDINIVANSSGTIAYDGAAGTTYGVNGGDQVAGQVVQNLVQGLTANHYFYLTAGTGDTAAAYTAGQFIFRLHGHPVLT